MTKNQELLIENILYDAIRTFHDCDDKQTREKYIKEYTLNFCEEHNIDPSEAIDKLNSLLRERRKNSQHQYEHYKGGKLRRIILPQKKSSDDKEITK